MSTPDTKALPPAALISSATLLAPSRFLSNTPTLAPYSANRRQMAPPIAPPPPVTMTFLPDSPRMARSSEGRVGIEPGLALLEVRGEAFLHLRPQEAQHLQRGRGVERGAHHAQPVVQRVLGEANRGLRALGELGRDFQAFGLELGVLDAHRYQADALGLFAVDRLAEQQVVLCLGHAAEQRPDDDGVVAGGDAEPGVAVDDLGLLRGDRHVGQDARDQARAYGGAAHGADDRLGAVDDVVDDVARLLPGPQKRVVVLHVLFDDVEVAAGREHLAAGALDDHAVDRVVAVDVAPHIDQLAMHDRVGRVVLFGAV